MINKLAFFTTIVILFVSCANKNEKSANKESTIDSTINTKQNNDPNLDPNFPLTSFDSAEFVFDSAYSKPKSNYSVFLSIINIKNNTNSKIIQFQITAFIKIKFKGEDYIYLPGDGFVKDDDSYDIYFDRTLCFDKNKISSSTPWHPNETKTFTFKTFEELVCSWKHISINPYMFERTPEEVSLIVKYKAINIDKEYKNILRYNILDQWKDFQTKLGLR